MRMDVIRILYNILKYACQVRTDYHRVAQFVCSFNIKNLGGM